MDTAAHALEKWSVFKFYNKRDVEVEMGIKDKLHEFPRDIYKDLSALEKAIGKNVEDASTLDTFSLEMFENIAYVMAKHADANIPDTAEEWLDGFNTFSIYQVLPQLIELWGLNVQTDVSAKKTSSNRSPDDNTFIFASLRTAGD